MIEIKRGCHLLETTSTTHSRLSEDDWMVMLSELVRFQVRPTRCLLGDQLHHSAGNNNGIS